MPIHVIDDDGNESSSPNRVRAFDGSTERDIQRVLYQETASTARVIYTRPALPAITSFTLAPTFYRDTDVTTAWATATRASMEDSTRSFPWNAAQATWNGNNWVTSHNFGAFRGVRYALVRVPVAEASLTEHYRIEGNPTRGPIFYATAFGSEITRDSNYAYFNLPVNGPGQGNITATLQYRTDTVGNLVLAFAVNNSTHNDISQTLKDGTTSNIPLSPSTGATIDAPEQDARYTLTARNSLGETVSQHVDYTFWTVPTLHVAVSAQGDVPAQSGQRFIRITVTRGGNPLPRVTYFAGDQPFTTHNVFSNDDASATFQINRGRTGTPFQASYHFTAQSNVGGSLRRASQILNYTWPA